MLSQPRRALAAIAGALVVIILAWFMFVYRPKGAEIADLEEQIATAEAEEQTLRATLEQLQSVDEDRPDEEAEVRRLTAAIPPDPELASFILAIHDLAARSDLDFASIAPALPSQAAGQAVSTIGTTMTVSGNFGNVVDFLDRLEGLERVVVVDSLALTASDAEEEAEATAASAGGLAGTASSPIVSPAASSGAVASTPVELTMGEGSNLLSVRTDAASAGQVAPTTTTTVDPRATSLLLPRDSVTRVGNRVLTVSITARIFTTAPPAGGGSDATTTTAPADGATTTTVGG